MKKKDDNNIALPYLKELFINSNDNNKVIAINLIDKAIFLEDTLSRLEDVMSGEDVIQDMPQGDYSIKVVNPVLKSYNTTIKNYQTIMKQINEMAEKSLSNDSKSIEEMELLQEYNNYVESHTEWINNQKKNGTYSHLKDDEKRVKEFKECKDNYLKVMDEFQL